MLLVCRAVWSNGRATRPETPPKAGTARGHVVGHLDGAGSGGGFELTLEQAKGRPGHREGRRDRRARIQGRVQVALVRREEDERQVRFPSDESAEVVLTTTFEGNKATGTWSLQAKGTDTRSPPAAGR